MKQDKKNGFNWFIVFENDCFICYIIMTYLIGILNLISPLDKYWFFIAPISWIIGWTIVDNIIK